MLYFSYIKHELLTGSPNTWTRRSTASRQKNNYHLKYLWVIVGGLQGYLLGGLEDIWVYFWRVFGGVFRRFLEVISPIKCCIKTYNILINYYIPIHFLDTWTRRSSIHHADLWSFWFLCILSVQPGYRHKVGLIRYKGLKMIRQTEENIGKYSKLWEIIRLFRKI